MPPLRARKVLPYVYLGTLNAFRPRGDALLRPPFMQIEPNWNLSDPRNPATDERYKQGLLGAFRPSPRHAALIEVYDRLGAAAETLKDVDGWPGLMADLTAARDAFKRPSAERSLAEIIRRKCV